MWSIKKAVEKEAKKIQLSQHLTLIVAMFECNSQFYQITTKCPFIIYANAFKIKPQ